MHHRDVKVSQKFRFRNVLRSHENTKLAFSNSSGLKSVLKAAFSGRISVDGRPNRRNKPAFSNFSAVVCGALDAFYTPTEQIM